MICRGLVLVAVLAGFFLACGGKIASDDGSAGNPGPGSSDPSKPTDGSCPAAGAMYCSADPPISSDDIAQCNKSLQDAVCGSAYKAYLGCAEQHITCDATNRTDSSTIETACNEQLNAYEQCIEGSPTRPSP